MRNSPNLDESNEHDRSLEVQLEIYQDVYGIMQRMNVHSELPAKAAEVAQYSKFSPQTIQVRLDRLVGLGLLTVSEKKPYLYNLNDDKLPLKKY